MAVAVSTPVYDGPLDVLLRLVLDGDVDLYAIDVCAVVDAYLAHLDELQAECAPLDLEAATEFLVLASTLVELKTTRLLPSPAEVELDESLWLWEERDLLFSRLVQCRTFAAAAERLVERFATARRSVGRRSGVDERHLDLSPELLTGVGVDDLHRAYLAAARPRPVPEVSLAHVAPIRVSVADAIGELCEVLAVRRSATFRQLTIHLRERVEVVVRFLAVLELHKDGIVELDQPTCFGELVVRWAGSAPSARDADAHDAGHAEAGRGVGSGPHDRWVEPVRGAAEATALVAASEATGPHR